MKQVFLRVVERTGAQRERELSLGRLPEGADAEVDVLALNAALAKLQRLDPRQARVVELRFFSGMSGDEIAAHLGVSRNTVVRELTMARAWLHRELYP